MRWFTRKNVLLTAAMVVWVPGCSLACWWQITVALSGDALADLYSVEWPVFAIFGIVAWWRLVHDEPGVARTSSAAMPDAHEDGVSVPARRRGEEDDELASYNDYLAELAKKGRKTWRRS